MSQERTIPNNAVHNVITFDILTDGSVIDPGYQVMSIVVTREVNRIPVARIQLRDGDAATEDFPISNEAIFEPGKELHIKVGYDGNNETIFKGIITKHGIRIANNGQANLEIEARDAAVKMTLGRKSAYYEEQTDSAVISDIIGKYRLPKSVDTTSLNHQRLVQHHCTDWDFIMARAEMNGLLIFANDGELNVKQPTTSGEAVLELTYGSTLRAFEAAMDAREQWQKVAAASWDFAAQQRFTGEASDATVPTMGNISASDLAKVAGPEEFELRHSGYVLSEELTEWSKAKMLRSRLAKIRGRAHIVTGTAVVKPDTLVKFSGVGERFNGNAYVTAVRHEILKGNWDTHIQFGLPPNCYAQQPEVIDYPAAALLPGVNGLQIGKVVKLQDDPDGEDRIQVRLPIIDPNASGIWCRVAALDAGNQRGSFFRPEIDDEVIVGFVNDDPRDAIVLGHLHSSASPAPVTAEDTNHIKGFYTRENMRLFFDDEKKTITIDTPAGNKIVIDEDTTSITIEDQNANKITLEPAGITMDSPKEINVKAGTAMNIEAGAALSIKGASVAIEAQSSLEAKGAIAKLEASGIMEVKGSLVKLN